MPAPFSACVKEGGKVSTKDLPEGKYIHLCKNKKGKWFRGEIKIKEKK